MWYDKHSRDLPWRENIDFYSVYLSEVMLQQTKVETVIPYYNKWLNEYPTIDSVAFSNLDDLLKLWEGLGYYSRCINFYNACVILHNQYNSQLPNNISDFIKLPGVGNYISSAVYSIVAKESIPAIDTNVTRVISRVLAIKNLTNYNKRRIRIFLQKFIDKDRPGDINQALMDLGSSICSYKNTQCTNCPINKLCKAKNLLFPFSYPMKSIKRSKKIKHFISALIFYNRKFLIIKRPYNTMLGGLWELPTTEVNKKNSEPTQLPNYIRDTLNFKIHVKNKICTIKHSYSHFNISLTLYYCITGSNKFKNIENLCWITNNDVPNYAFSKSNHKLFKILDANNWNV